MRRVLVWIGLPISGIFVWLALRDVDFAHTWRALRGASYWTLVPAFAALAAANALRALRWQALFEPRRRPPLRAIIHAMLIGLFFNAILPARAGEAARVVALWREARTPRAEALATAAAERVYDVLGLLFLLLVVSPFVPDVPWIGSAVWAAGVLGGAIAAGVVVLVRWDERPLRHALHLLERMQLLSSDRADSAASNLVEGLASFRSVSIAARAAALTLASWLVIGFSSWFLLLGFDSHLGYTAGLLVTLASSLVLVLPAAPGGIGQFEAATIAALSVFTVNRSLALSYGVVLHALNLLPYLVIGYVALYRHAATAWIERRFA